MRFDQCDYHGWRETRFSFIVKHYGAEFFKGKSLVEVGAGYGHLGNMFHELGARVTCTDGRIENVEGIRERFPHLNSFVCDLENDFPDEHFDICIHTGVLYHLANPEAAIIRSCASSNHLVLETETLDNADAFLAHSIIEDMSIIDNAVSGKGVRLTAAHIEKVLSEQGKVFMRCDNEELNYLAHRYNWVVSGSNGYGPQFRRFWFVK